MSNRTRSIGLRVIGWPLVAAGLVAVAILAGGPTAPAGGGPDDWSPHATELLTTPEEVVPAVVAQVRRVEWRPADRSPRGGFPIALATLLALPALAAADVRRLAPGPSGNARFRAARTWRGRAPPACSLSFR